ncbi:MAG: hypothetical protein HLUCCA08_14690 [Rhodobacteraceae bacterium HLUCCA08]|nr:MAG: hypothetical protein HLUCCA08_14690 [Rhodobacteraceae bacterium HLUCCA08]
MRKVPIPLILTSLVLAASAAPAQTALRDTDRAYGASELTAMLAGHAVEYHDGSVSRYRADGAYSYKYTDTDRPHLGVYRVLDAGRVCVAFVQGGERCDTFVDDGTRMVLVIEDGTRFPVRARRPLVDGY